MSKSENRIVLVIGSSCGFGCNMVEYFVCCGVGVVIIYCSNQVEVEMVVVEVWQVGVKVVVLCFDVVDSSSFVVFVE